jgi:hypothetical protein
MLTVRVSPFYIEQTLQSIYISEGIEKFSSKFIFWLKIADPWYQCCLRYQCSPHYQCCHNH